MRLRKRSPRIRFAALPNQGPFLRFVISAVWVSHVSRLSAADSTNHPCVDTKAQTPAAVKTLWLSCHTLNQPGATMNGATKMVSLLGGKVYDLASEGGRPKIGQRQAKNHISHRAEDPVNDKESVKREAELNRFPCHKPHAPKAEHLLRVTAGSRGVAKNLSLGSYRDFMGGNRGSQNVLVLQGPIPGGRL